MAKYRTLDLYPQSVETVPAGPGRYITRASMIDWDDGVQMSLEMTTPGPIIAVYPIKLRMQTEETLENPEEGSGALPSP